MKLLVPIAVFFVLTLFVSPAYNQTYQTQRAISSPVGVNSPNVYEQAIAINENGRLVGRRTLINIPFFDGFSFPPLYGMLLGSTAGSEGRFVRVSDINDSGLKVGSCRYNNYDYVPCTWNEDSLGLSLGFIDGYVNGNALSVNNRGEIVGLLQRTFNYGLPEDKPTRAFIYSNNEMRIIGTFSGGFSAASSINDFGKVVGASDGQAFIWDEQNGLRTLDSFITNNQGWTFTSAKKINNLGEIIGQGTINQTEKNFYWDGNTVFDLGRVSDYDIDGLNDFGQVVGVSYDNDGNSQPFLWDIVDGFRNISDLVSENGWIWRTAADINNKGQIIVEGYNEVLRITRVWILTPFQEREPLIFIPGIMGSNIKGDWNGRTVPYWININPIATYDLPSVYNLTLDVNSPYYTEGLYASDVVRTALEKPVYEPLLNALEANGYKPYDISRHVPPNQGCDLSQKNNEPARNPSLFVFPYDWRQDNNQIADRLKEYVQCVQQFYPAGTKINIVAHSMGGLVARRYVLQAQTRNEPHGLGKVVTLASPYLGAPESVYKIYTGGSWEFPFSFVVISPSTIKFLSPHLPSMHQLFPSHTYHQLYGGIIRESGDVNGNGIPDENYSFPQIISKLDSDFPSTTPGTVGAGFHDFAGQDDWRNDQSGIEYYHLVAEQNQFNTTTDLKIKKSILCNIVGDTTLTNCHNGIYYTPEKGAGDKTVPTISASRSVGSVYLGAPNSECYIYRSPSSNRADESKAEHTAITQNPGIHDFVTFFLGVSLLPIPSPISLASCSPQNTNQAKVINSENNSVSNKTKSAQTGNNKYLLSPDSPEYSSAKYLTITGTTEVIVRDELGNRASIENGLLNNQVDGLSNYEVIGENSIMLTLSVGHTYSIEFYAGETPMGFDLVEGIGNRQPTSAIRYNDVTIPAYSNVKFTVSQNNQAELKYDADNDSEFDTIVPPTVSVNGAAASDTTPPTLNINVIQQGVLATATITAQDSESGVSKIWYSLDGINYQLYTNPLPIPYSSSPINIEVFADDVAANRSGLYSKTFTFTQTQTNLAVKPILECVSPNSNGTYTANFGYENYNSASVSIPLSEKNKFTPVPKNRGQVTMFQVGRVTNAFSVIFSENNLKWHLTGPDNIQQNVSASRNSPRCQ